MSSPLFISQVMGVIARLRISGTTILLVEQMVERALEVADYAFAMQNGTVLGHGSAEVLTQRNIINQAYMRI